MKQYNAVYSVSDRPIEDFYMEEPNLPEWRKKDFRLEIHLNEYIHSWCR